MVSDNQIIALIDYVRLQKKLNLPGPGQYQPKTDMDKYGVYFVSTIE